MNEGITRIMDEMVATEEAVPFWDASECVTFVGGEAKIRAQAMKEMRQAVIKEMKKHE